MVSLFRYQSKDSKIITAIFLHARTVTVSQQPPAWSLSDTNVLPLPGVGSLYVAVPATPLRVFAGRWAATGLALRTVLYGDTSSKRLISSLARIGNAIDVPPVGVPHSDIPTTARLEPAWDGQLLETACERALPLQSTVAPAGARPAGATSTSSMMHRSQNIEILSWVPNTSHVAAVKSSLLVLVLLQLLQDAFLRGGKQGQGGVRGQLAPRERSTALCSGLRPCARVDMLISLVLFAIPSHGCGFWQAMSNRETSEIPPVGADGPAPF